VERRGYAPGEHGRARKRILGYGLQLREKQKLKRFYGMTENQFRLFFRRAERQKGITGENLLAMLERRLDNVIFIMGFARSRSHGRQLISHGHFSVNGRRTDVPSMIVRLGDSVAVREGSRTRPYFKDLAAAAETRTVPRWLERDLKGLAGKVLQNPERTDIDASLHEQLIVEFYSR
jgi:small subunit ribosomal protein S4